VDPQNEEIKNRLETVSSGLSINSKYDYLISQKKITVQQLQQALSQSKRLKKSVEFVLLQEFEISIEDLGKSLSLYFNCPFKAYDPSLESPFEIIRKLKKAFLRNALWVPLSWGKDGIDILIDDPKDLSKTDQIRALLKTDRVNFYVGIKEHIEEFINHFFDESRMNHAITSGQEQNKGFDSIIDIEFEEEGVDAPEQEEEEPSEESLSQVVKLVDQVIVTAYRKNISDIHFEPFPESKCVNIRFRIDGICQDYFKVPLSLAKGILSRIKVMAQLDIAERRLPQDGKIKFRRKGLPTFELRVATLPTTAGYEDAVLRILNMANALDLETTGLNQHNLNIFHKIITQPYGIVLVVGPTGSGKTTTLHSALGYINKPGIKIWTAEDPIEIIQHRLRQVEAKPQIGLDFARIMRAFLRADPDVIMIGEMRDQETASIALEASLTGHLVFSTLHTNNSAETITRILDMGFNPIYFADALLGVLAQRLVRKLCTECRESYHPSEQEFEEVVSEYGETYFKSTGIDLNAELSLYRPVGCDSCSNTGYSGRMAIHELLENTTEIKQMIKKQESTENISKAAMKVGMTTMKQDGIVKVFEGLTDMSEVRRVCIN
jgi:type II secretory ATPase GspE/PulE/Tfp pilus assembly ATPase PilB-like protein